jgi:short subunit dehydrogenase-like uncharacterized protein
MPEPRHSGPSGGTLNSIFNLISTFSLSELGKLSHPYALSPITPKPKPRVPLVTKIFGIRTVPGLGALTTSILAAGNVSTVHRSSGVMPALYGPNFHYAEYARTRNILTGLLTHFGLAFGALLIAFPPSRWILRKFIRQPGEGSIKEATENESFEQRAIATADTSGSGAPKKAFAKFQYRGGLYLFTGLMLVEAAIVVLKDEEKLLKKLGGGVHTPATLGNAFVERLQKAGCEIEVKMMDE